MKKLLLGALFCLLAASLFAGGAENKVNMSAGYIRNPSKNTETKKADAALYNQAGTAFMEEGLYVDAGNQFVFKEYTHDASDISVSKLVGGTIDLDKYSSDLPSLLYPNAEIVWKKDNFALFGTFGIHAGGGGLEYEEGTLTTNAAIQKYIGYNAITAEDVEHSFEAFSATFGETIGGSYAFKDMVSVSAAVRFLQGKATRKTTLDETPTGAVSVMTGGSKTLADAEAEATGFCFIFGVHAKPVEKLDLSVQYQTMAKMEYEYTKADGEMADDFNMVKGEKYDQDLPAMFAFGVGYQILPELYASAGFNYYFNKQADLKNMSNEDSDDYAEYDDSWEVSLGAEYQINKMIAVSAGGFYSKQGYKDGANSPENPLLDSLSIGAGVGLNFVKNLTIDVGILKPIYFDADYEATAGDLELSKNVTTLAIGASYKIF